MSIDKTWQTESDGPETTEELAEAIGHNLKGGELIELISDLGGGKTTFVRGLARGIDCNEQVTSPTFKISNEYQGKKLRLYHFDFYRLPEPGIVVDELAEIVGDPTSVVVIEWADAVQSVIPTDRLSVVMTNKSEQERHLVFSYPASLAYLLKGLL